MLVIATSWNYVLSSHCEEMSRLISTFMRTYQTEL